jgi:LysM repeat protein
MNDTPAIVDRTPGTRSDAKSRGGVYAISADFGATLANAHEVSRPVEDRPVAGAQDKHLVQSGETLYGIAKARLAAAGQAATPRASMQYALEIAKTNEIRNPDRIYAGQRLQLSAPVATVIGNNHAPVEARSSTAYSDVASTYAVHAPDSRHAMQAADLSDEVTESAKVFESKIVPAYEQPTIPGATAAGNISSEDDVRTRPESVDRVRASLALYQQVAQDGVPKPPSEVADWVYKGVVGKALDMASLEPSTRTGLQQANAVIGNVVAGRSLAALTGLGGPLLTIVGLVWGIFSAQKIGAGQSGASNQVVQNTHAATID